MFSSSWIHHHTTYRCDLPHNTCEPLQPLTHDTHPHWTHYQLHPLPVAPSDWYCISDGQMTYEPCYYLPISRQVPCHFFYIDSFCTLLILYYVTALVSYPTHPVAGWPVTSHCATWSVSQRTCCHFTADEPCACFLVYLIPCIYCTKKKEVFPQSSDLASCFRLITLCSILQMYPHLHQEIGETLVWPDSYDQNKSGWYHVIFPNI